MSEPNPRQNVTFASNGGQAHGYLAKPESGSGPGLVVIQEWWGLDDHMADIVDRFAAEGFVALAPDLFGGRVAHDADEAGKFMEQLPADQAARDLGGAVDFLLADDVVTSSKVGAVGFCMGGGFVLQLAAQQGDKIGAAVPFYGVGPAVPEQYNGITAPVQGHYGEEDEFYPVDQAREQEQQLPRADRIRRRVLLLPRRPRVPQRQGQARHLRRAIGPAGVAAHRRVPEGQPDVSTVRPARASDAAVIRDVTTRAFGDARVADLVDVLAAGPARVSLVAEVAGAVVGHTMLSRGWIDAERELVEALVLSPLSVAPEHQRHGHRRRAGARRACRGRAHAGAGRVPRGLAGVLLAVRFRAGAGPRVRPALGADTRAARFQVVVLPAWEPWMTGALVYPEAFWILDFAGLRGDRLAQARAAQ